MRSSPPTKASVGTFNEDIDRRIQGLEALVAAQGTRIGAIDELEKGMASSDLGDRLSEVDITVATLRSAVGETTSAVATVQAELAELASTKTSVGTFNEDIDRRIEGLEAMVAAQGTRIGAIDELEKGMASSDLGDRLSEVDITVATLRSAVGETTSAVAKLQAGLAEVEHALEARGRDVDDSQVRLEKIVSDMRDVVAALPGADAFEVQALASELAAIRANASAATDRIERLEVSSAAIAESSAATAELGRQIAAVRSELERPALTEELASQLEIVRASASSATDRVTRLEGVGMQVVENTAMLERLEHTLEDLQAHLADTRPAPSAAPRISAALRTLDQRLENLERREDGIAAELERARTLWPIALRSLEARLDDLAIPVETRSNGESDTERDELRSSLETMGTIANGPRRPTDPPDSNGAADLTDSNDAADHSTSQTRSTPRGRARRART